MPLSPIEYLTTECPNGHRVRGDLGWLNREVRCPHCDTAFTFRRPGGTAAEVVAIDGTRIQDRPSVSDTGVMRILGNIPNPAEHDDGTVRHCSNCGATYPGYVPTCYNCNLELGPPVKEGQDTASEVRDIDFRQITPFPFEDVAVRKVMRPRKEIIFLEVNATHSKMLDDARNTRHTRYPVCDHSLDRLAGLVHIEDLVLADGAAFDVHKILKPLTLISDATPVSEVLQSFQKGGEPMAMVVDEYETIVGMVTAKDVMLKMVKIGS